MGFLFKNDLLILFCISDFSFTRNDLLHWLHTTPTGIPAHLFCTHHLPHIRHENCMLLLLPGNKTKEAMGAMRPTVTLDGVFYIQLDSKLKNKLWHFRNKILD